MAIMEQVQDLAENIKALRRWILKNIHIREPFLNDGTEYPEKMKHAAFTGSVIGKNVSNSTVHYKKKTKNKQILEVFSVQRNTVAS